MKLVIMLQIYSDIFIQDTEVYKFYNKKSSLFLLNLILLRNLLEINKLN